MQLIQSEATIMTVLRRWIDTTRYGRWAIWGKQLSSLLLLWQKKGGSSVSVEYRVWQNQFLAQRLRLFSGLGLLVYLTYAIVHLEQMVWHPTPENIQSSLEFYSLPVTFERLRQWTLTVEATVISLLSMMNLVLWRTSWGQRHQKVMFLATSWTVTLIPLILGTLLGFPLPGLINAFILVQAILVSVNWRLHVLAQLVPVIYYFAVHSLLDRTGRPEFSSFFGMESMLSVFWICLISDVAVFLYDRLQQREFESKRELRLFIHALTHDLRIPVLGTSVVLQSLLRKSEAANGQAIITTPKLEQLLAGNDRQLTLINSILIAHKSEVQGISLNCQPLQLGAVVAAVLDDATSLLTQNQVVLTNRITADLPLIQADVDQLWRVFSNLITNALNHNPAGIHLTIDAVQQNSQSLYCTIQDSGIGIPTQQQQRLFELYYRGERSRYMPGLGLGLYLCRQIIIAHGGQIGVISQPGSGSIFWFTLPIAPKPGPIVGQ
jgi:signal transduction histidine kinase